jgi:hypothetical protein
MCVNKPVINPNQTLNTCTDDLQCATCTGSPTKTCGAEFLDFQGRTCDSGRDCAPIGACREPLLKVSASGTSWTNSIDAVHELTSDPDEEMATNLRNTTAVHASQLSILEPCLREFWELQGNLDEGVWHPMTPSNCPAVLHANAW